MHGREYNGCYEDAPACTVCEADEKALEDAAEEAFFCNGGEYGHDEEVEEELSGGGHGEHTGSEGGGIGFGVADPFFSACQCMGEVKLLVPLAEQAYEGEGGDEHDGGQQDVCWLLKGAHSYKVEGVGICQPGEEEGRYEEQGYGRNDLEPTCGVDGGGVCSVLQIGELYVKEPS